MTSLNQTSEQLWDDMLVHIVEHKLDSSTRGISVLEKGTICRRSTVFVNFFPLALALSRNSQQTRRAKTSGKTNSKVSSKVSVATTSTSSQSPCPLCKESHYFSACPIFVQRNTSQRRKLVLRHRRCFNCLSDKHAVKDFKSKFSYCTC